MYKKLIENKKGVLFDLDGTIVETDPYYIRAFQIILGKACTYAEGSTVLINSIYFNAGISIEKKWDELIKQNLITTSNTIPDLVKQCNEEYLNLIKDHKVNVKDGFHPFLFELKINRNLKIGLTTNTDRVIALETLKKVGINTDTFDVIVFGDDVKNKKPNPEIYLLASKKMGIPPKHLTAFEDSVAGATSAIKAGIDTAIILNDLVKQGDYPKNILDKFIDFSGLDHNLDLDYKEAWEEYSKEMLEREQKKNKK